MAPEITVIIPSYNSANSLEYCLRSIREQGMDVEIIVSDRQSKDGTPEVVKRYGGRLISKDCERAEAKNVALREAQGRYVLFMDADMELTPGVLMQCLYAAEKPQVGGVIISERSVGDSFWVKVRDHERLFYAGTDIESARFFPRSLALEAGGFSSEVVFFEESVLPQKIKAMGYSIDERIEAPILHHEENFSLPKWLKKKAYYGRTARQYRAMVEDGGKEQTSFIGRMRMFLGKKRFYSRPVYAIGVVVLKTLEFAAAGYGYATSG